MMNTRDNDPLPAAQQEALRAVHNEINDYVNLLPTNRHAEVRAITADLAEANAVAQTAAQTVHAALNDLDIHPDGRRARAEQARQDGRAKVSDLHSAARARAQVLTAALEGEALAPPEGAADAALARQDAALVLGISDNPEKALHALAKDPDLGIATLVAGPWGSRYLAAAGIPDAADVMRSVRHAALTTIAAKGGTDNRVKAARARLESNTIDTVIAGYESVTSALLP